MPDVVDYQLHDIIADSERKHKFKISYHTVWKAPKEEESSIADVLRVQVCPLASLVLLFNATASTFWSCMPVMLLKA